MAKGDVKAGMTFVVNGDFLTIKPATSEEWVIHNIYYNGAVEFYKTDGTNNLKFDNDTTSGARLGAVFHATEAQYFKIKNVSGASIYIAYDGVQTK